MATKTLHSARHPLHDTLCMSLPICHLPHVTLCTPISAHHSLQIALCTSLSARRPLHVTPYTSLPTRRSLIAAPSPSLSVHRSRYGTLYTLFSTRHSCSIALSLSPTTKGDWDLWASVCHALGRGAVRCRAGARRRWSGGVCPGRRALGCAQCLRGRGEGAAASRPALQGFRRRRPRVGVRGGRRGVRGRVLAGCGWRASGCALLLRWRDAGGAASLRVTVC